MKKTRHSRGLLLSTIFVAQLGVIATTGCAGARKIDETKIASTNSIALVDFSGRKRVDTSGGLVSLTQTFAQDWGVDLLPQLHAVIWPMVTSRIGTKFKFIEGDAVAASAAYQALKAQPNSVSVPPLKALNILNEHVDYGTVAQETGADAVLSMRFSYAMRKERGRGGSEAECTTRIWMGDVAGETLWEQTEITRSNLPFSLDQIGRDLVGSTPKESSLPAIKSACIQGVDVFLTQLDAKSAR